MRIGSSAASCRITRRILSSSSIESPYPDFTSTVVVPYDASRCSRGRASASSSVLVARAHVAHRGVDAPALPRDLHVIGTGGAALLLLVARLAEDRVRVRVDEPRREHAAAAVDDRAPMRTRARAHRARADLRDPLAVHRHRDVLAHARSRASPRPRARARGPAQVTTCFAFTNRSVRRASLRRGHHVAHARDA